MRGADGYVFAEIQKRMAGASFAEISLSGFAVETGYSIPAICAALKRLERRRHIERLAPAGPRRAARYTVVPVERRHAILAAEYAGLIKPELMYVLEA